MIPAGLTAELAEFIARPPWSVPEDAARIVRAGFTDAVASMIAGRDEPVVRIVRGFVEEKKSQAAQARLVFDDVAATSADAALISGTAAHALDYDDVAIAGHPSAVLVPALLSEGQYLAASGRDAIRAYLVGYEVWAELLARDPDPYHIKGWHPTAVLGTVAAAAATAHLHGLSAALCGNAIGLAASMASGLVANFGSMAKPLHAGRAAACGIDAVRLAAAGLTASADVFEHGAGYLAALSPKDRADRGSPASSLGVSLRILDTGLSVKRYPMCYAAHRVIDGVLDLQQSHDVDWRQVQAVHAAIGPAQAAMLRNHTPETGLSAKFSLEFAVASALIARQVGLAQLTDAFVADERVRELMPRVRTEIVDTACPIEPVFALTDRVRLDLKDKRVLDSGPIRFARGNAKLPLSDRELEAKFMDCAAHTHYSGASALLERLRRLDELDSLRDLVDARFETPASA